MLRFFWGLLFFISFQVCSQEKLCRISGKIKGLDSKQMMLIVFDPDSPNGFSRDSVLVENESFTYEFPVKKFLYANISPNVDRIIKKSNGGYFPVKSSVFQFFVAPGYDVTFSGEITDFVNAYPSGNDVNLSYGALTRLINPLQNQSVNLLVKITNKIVTDSILIKIMRDTMALLDRKVIKYKEDFIRSNQNNPAASWLLSDMMMRSQVANSVAVELFNGLNPAKMLNVLYYKELTKRVEGLSATAVGKQVPEVVTSNTFTGNKFQLSSLRGKYIILDFWGTWCGPCIAGMPKMKVYFDQYKDKLEIVGIAQESDNGSRWKKFISDKPQYAWHQILNTKENDFVLQFNVAGFPTKFIIDPNGKILGRFVGEDDQIYNKIDELLK